MKIIPRNRDDLGSLVETALKSGALLLDVLFTRGIAQFIVSLGLKKRLDKTLKELKDIPTKVKKEIQTAITLDYIKSDDFLVFYSNAITEAMSLKNIEKIKYFKSAIINGIIKTDLEQGKKLLFINCLSDISTDAIILLGLIDKMCVRDKDARLTFRQINQRSEYKDYSYLMANLKMLERCNLVEIEIPTVKEDNYDNYVVKYRTFGKEFISFVMDYQ